MQRLFAGICDIVLGFIFIGVPICIYIFSDFSNMGDAKTFYFILYIFVVPFLGLVLIGVGIKNLVKKENEE